MDDPILRTKSSAFTRNRKLGAKRLQMILLQRLANGLQLGLDHFYSFLEEQPISKQAFSKARARLKPEFVRKFADRIAGIHGMDAVVPSSDACARISSGTLNPSALAIPQSPRNKRFPMAKKAVLP